MGDKNAIAERVANLKAQIAEEKSEFEKLLPSKIASIEVNKEDGISVIDVVTKK